MKKSLMMEKYPVFSIEIDKNEISVKTMEELVSYFKTKIENNPAAKYIALFDHLAHTKSLNGEYDNSIKEAINVVFCFGHKLPSPQIMAARPRSIGLVEKENSFFITFLEAPMSQMNELMESWCKELLINN